MRRLRGATSWKKNGCANCKAFSCIRVRPALISALSAALAQLVRALECGSRGPLFKSGRRYHLKAVRNQFAGSMFASRRTSPVETSKTNIRFPSITTAVHPSPKVIAVGAPPSGKLMDAGNAGSRGDAGACKRMTSNAMMVRTPRIMVAVNTVTSILRNLRFFASLSER